MVESLVLRLRKLRAAFTAAWKRLINGRRTQAKQAKAMVSELSNAVLEAERVFRDQQKQGYEHARRTLLANALLLGGLVASVVYAPVAQQYSWAVWVISSALAELLARRGVNWQAAWREASLNLTGW